MVSRAFTVLVFGLIAVAILSRADFHRSDTKCHLSASANLYYYTTFCINVDSDECKKTRKFALRDIVVEYFTGVLNGKMYTMHMLERASIDLIAKALHGMFDTDGTNDVAFVQDCMRYIRKRISKKTDYESIIFDEDLVDYPVHPQEIYDIARFIYYGCPTVPL